MNMKPQMSILYQRTLHHTIICIAHYSVTIVCWIHKFSPLPLTLKLTLPRTHFTWRILCSRTLDIAIRARLHLWWSHSGSLPGSYFRNAAVFAVESPEFVLAVVGVVDAGYGEGDI